VSPKVDNTSISYTFWSLKYLSIVFTISGEVALKPAKNPTPKRAISNIDINLLYETFISLKLSFNNAFFNL